MLLNSIFRTKSKLMHVLVEHLYVRTTEGSILRYVKPISSVQMLKHRTLPALSSLLVVLVLLLMKQLDVLVK